jgi:hypothetical protein
VDSFFHFIRRWIMSSDEYGWDRVRDGSRSGILVQTDDGSLDAVEIIAGMHDHRLKEDADDYKKEAMEVLTKNLFARGHAYSNWVHVFLAALSDPAFPRLGKAYALQAASTVKSPEVLSVLKTLIPEEELGYVKGNLPGAFYRQGDADSIDLLIHDADKGVASKAKFFEAALSWETKGKYCPHMDEHSVCLHGAGTDSCPMINHPYDYSKNASTGKVIVLPKDTNYLYCPRYQSRSPFH